MIRPLSPRVEAVFWFLLTATGYFLLASVSLYATKGADNIAAVWPPSGYFLALLLLMPVRMRIVAFAAMAAASMSANMSEGIQVAAAAAYTVANAAEAVIALWLVRRHEAGEMSFMAPRAVGRFCIAALTASAGSAVIATLLTGNGFDFLPSWRPRLRLLRR